MRIRSPSSRARLRIRFSPLDIAIAAASPYLALCLRNALVLGTDPGIVLLYCVVSFGFSLVGFAVFQVEGALPRYFSVGDVQNVLKAVLVAELLSAAVLFTVTRLDGMPRSVPAIHALILAAGLFAARGLLRIIDKRRDLHGSAIPADRENLILVGVDDVSVLLIGLLDASAPCRQVIALLDPEPRMVGRSVQGVRVFGPPVHLEGLIEEFGIHGVRTHRVLVNPGSGTLRDGEVRQVEAVCAKLGVEMSSVQDLISPSLASRIANRAADRVAVWSYQPPSRIRTSGYFRAKGRIDFVAALILLLLFWPFWALAVLLAFCDVGSPTLFWQQRVGLHAREFQLYKVRTLRAAYDRRGQRTPEDRRVSWVGRLLRRTRLDELPQLMNVLVGDMSLIGPRPLLLQDQPADPSVRLLVRPGITGWAQVNGGALLSAEEKDALDAWYVQNASLWLDLRIIAGTARSLVRGDCRSERALAQARASRGAADRHRPAAGREPLADLVPVAVGAAAPRRPMGGLAHGGNP
jgi:lipopolysaccharide/colanic/teichoic acid biosynthesis glycosyltransferase